MAKLILLLDGKVLKERDLDKETISIGRSPDNDIQIDNLGVSHHHATITTSGNMSIIKDAGSTNGVLVNGAPITKHLLTDDDVVEIGKFHLGYVSNEKLAADDGTDSPVSTQRVQKELNCPKDIEAISDKSHSITKEKTLYQILGTSNDASDEMIFLAYGHQKSRFNNALNGSDDAPTEIQLLESCFAILSNPTSRKAYDENLRIRGNREAELIRNTNTVDHLDKPAGISGFKNSASLRTSFEHTNSEPSDYSSGLLRIWEKYLQFSNMKKAIIATSIMLIITYFVKGGTHTGIESIDNSTKFSRNEKSEKATQKADVAAGVKLVRNKIEIGKGKIAGKFRDPSSAQFRGVTRVTEGDMVCGEVNAKNSYGGYVGFHRFFVDPGSSELHMIEPSSNDDPAKLRYFDTQYEKYCSSSFTHLDGKL